MTLGHFSWLLGKATHDPDALVRHYEDGEDIDSMIEALRLASAIDNEMLSLQAQERHAGLLAARERYRS